MRQLIVIAALFFAAPMAALGQSQGGSRTFIVGGELGIGGPVDADQADAGNFGWQLSFSNNIAERTHFGIRLGGIDFGSGDRLGELSDPGLLYVTLAGEYRERGGSFSGSFIDPGVFVGIGLYRLDGTRADGVDDEDEAVGLVVGLTGDVPLTKERRLMLRIELQGHYADLDESQIFVLGLVGVAYRF